MVYTKAGQADKIAKGTVLGVELGGKKMVISNLDGIFYAIGSKCTHMGCNLSGGIIDSERVTCPCHGSVFNLKTGEVLQGPARTPEPTFKVKVENGELMVDI